MKTIFASLFFTITSFVAFSQVPPPPPPPPPPPAHEGIYVVVEDMPLFPGCEDVKPKDEKRTCANNKMLAFVYENLSYPDVAKRDSIEGTVVVRFVVEKDGSISEAKILKDIGAGCGIEALRVVNEMPNWEPGKQRGQSVRVNFTLPIKFSLENIEE